MMVRIARALRPAQRVRVARVVHRIRVARTSRAGRIALRAALVAAVLAASPPNAPAHAQSRAVDVRTADDLARAIAAAEPGDVITLAPGTYDLPPKLAATRPGDPAHPITVRAATLGDARLRFASTGGTVVEGFHVLTNDWRFENLDIEGVCPDDSLCEHAFHIVGDAERTVVDGCRLHGFNAMIKGNGAPDGDGVFHWPDDVVIRGTEFFSPAGRKTDNPVTPIDVVGGRRWRVVGNFIHDHFKDGGDHISYAAFLKGNSRDGVFERNLVVCELLHKGGLRLGLSFGGGGSSPPRICEDGTCTPEHQGGVMRNNVIAHCPADVGIYLNKAQGTRIEHNTLYDTAGIDVRFAASDADITGNLVMGKVRQRDGGIARIQSTLQLSAADFKAWFRDPDARDFSLRDGGAVVDHALPLPGLVDDWCGDPRTDDMPDIGAFEYANGRTCDTTGRPPMGGMPRPTAVRPTAVVATAVATAQPTLTLTTVPPTALPTALPTTAPTPTGGQRWWIALPWAVSGVRGGDRAPRFRVPHPNI
ncbi:MAG: right-handed parallel beta-helix repeat-containing protein [Ardenticatenales bacterium]